MGWDALVGEKFGYGLAEDQAVVRVLLPVGVVVVAVCAVLGVLGEVMRRGPIGLAQDLVERRVELWADKNLYLDAEAESWEW